MTSAAKKRSPDEPSDIRDCPIDVATPPPGFAGAHPGYGSERRHAANRRNARRSTGPRGAAGKARVKLNALRHGLNVKVADDPLLTEEVERIARAICDGAPRGGAKPAELAYLARRVAEAQVDLMRVRRARHAMMTRALDNPRYRSPRYLRRQIAMLVAVGELLARGLAVPDDMRKAAFGRPQGALKFALVITDLAHELARFERYERRALSRRKAAVAAFDAACAGQAMPVLIELPAAPSDREALRWRNKATAGGPSGSLPRLRGRVREGAIPRHGAGGKCPLPNPPPQAREGEETPDQERWCWWNKAIPPSVPVGPGPGWRNKATATAPSAQQGPAVGRSADRLLPGGSVLCLPAARHRLAAAHHPRDGPPYGAGA